MPYQNPYSGTTFFGFFVQLFWRLIAFLTGKISFQDMVSDEIQMVVLIAVAVSSALVGTFLILRKMTMLANSLSHTILLGIVVAFILTHNGVLDHGHQPINIKAMLLASLVMGVVTTFLTEIMTKVAKLQEDASTGIVFTSLFALGVIMVTLLTRSAHIGTEVVMGNVDSLQLEDCKLVYVILLINAAFLIFFFKEYQITTFDPGLSNALGFSPVIFNYLLMIQVSATTIAGFRAVGVLMILALITGPVLTARLLTHNLKTLLCLAAIIGSVASIIGVALSRHFLSVRGIALSTGGVVVCTILFFYVLTLIYQFWKVFYVSQTKVT